LAKRPHVILIMTDQHRRDTLGAYGDWQCHTPHLDALADGSVIFDRHYSPAPLCVPTRTALATGLYPHHSGAMINTWIPEERKYGTLSAEHTTVFERLTQHGYRLGHMGVEHIYSEPPFRDRCPGAEFAGNREYREYLKTVGLDVPTLWEYRAPTPEFVNGKMTSYWYTTAHTGRHPIPLEHFYDTYVANRAVQFIERNSPDQPLALACLFWAPHPPLAVPAPYDSLYDADALELPANVGQWYDGQPAMQLTNLPGFMGATLSMDQWRQAWAAYLGLVTMVDHCIGRVIESLRRQGFWDDALVIVTADHGEMLGSHRMFQKMCMYEEAVRVPLFIKPPGRRDGGSTQRRGQLTSHVDLAGTICDYAGIDSPGGDGMSLRAVIEQPDSRTREVVFSEFNGNAGRGFFQRAAITAGHKYIYNHGDHPELYDLESDPFETQNLSAAEGHDQVERSLRRVLGEWMETTGDFLKMD